MKLSDIVGHWDLAVYPKVAMVIFLAVFVGVLWRVFVSKRGRELGKYAWMAIEDDGVVVDAGRGQADRTGS